MFKAIKNEKIISISETQSGFIRMNKDRVEEDTEHTCEDYKLYGDEYILKNNIPIDYQNEQIRQQRQARYEVESDPLRLDYDEALAREQDNAEELKQQWLASKDKIREELPYV